MLASVKGGHGSGILTHFPLFPLNMTPDEVQKLYNQSCRCPAHSFNGKLNVISLPTLQSFLDNIHLFFGILL